MLIDAKITSIFSYALTMIVALEGALPQAGIGTTKKQIVLNGIETALKATSTVTAAIGQPEIAALTTLAGSFIDQTVNALKAAKAGPFQASAAVDAATAVK